MFLSSGYWSSQSYHLPRWRAVGLTEVFKNKAYIYIYLFFPLRKGLTLIISFKVISLTLCFVHFICYQLFQSQSEIIFPIFSS